MDNKIDIQAIESTYPNPGFPTIVANGSQNIPITSQINRDITKLLQKATLVLEIRS